jgi:hypothetical protein
MIRSENGGCGIAPSGMHGTAQLCRDWRQSGEIGTVEHSRCISESGTNSPFNALQRVSPLLEGSPAVQQIE